MQIASDSRLNQRVDLQWLASLHKQYQGDPITLPEPTSSALDLLLAIAVVRDAAQLVEGPNRGAHAIAKECERAGLVECYDQIEIAYWLAGNPVDIFLLMCSRYIRGRWLTVPERIALYVEIQEQAGVEWTQEEVRVALNISTKKNVARALKDKAYAEFRELLADFRGCYSLAHLVLLSCVLEGSNPLPRIVRQL